MSIFKNNGNTIVINGERMIVQGNNITINNGTVIVDGAVIKSGLTGDVRISFEGDLANLNVDGSATVRGNVMGNIDAGGSVTCNNVLSGDVDAGGSVRCGDVHGRVDAGGSISIHAKR